MIKEFASDRREMFVGLKHHIIFVLLAICSVAAYYFDSRNHSLAQVRAVIGYVYQPVDWLLSAPIKTWNTSADYIAGIEQLRSDRDQLHQEVEQMKFQISELERYRVDLDNLRQQLDLSSQIDGNYVPAEVLTHQPNIFTHRKVISRGSGDGIEVGMGVLDEQGIVGQVVEVGLDRSIIRLITEENALHSGIIERENYKVLLRGLGVSSGLLTLMYIPKEIAIYKGDVISSVSDHLPDGYKLAEVISVEYEGGTYQQIVAKPYFHPSTQNLMVFLSPSADAIDDGLREQLAEEQVSVVNSSQTDTHLFYENN